MKAIRWFFVLFYPVIMVAQQDSTPNDNVGKYRISDRFRTVYQIKESYQMDYYFVVKGDSFKVQINRDSSYPNDARLVPLKDTSKLERVVDQIIFDKEAGLFEGGAHPQTYISYHYLNAQKQEIDWDGTGIIENDTMIWAHPMRGNYFFITEFNPFPYLKLPLKKNKTWTWDLVIHSKGDKRWKEWTEPQLVNTYQYKVTKQYKATLENQRCDCWIVRGIASNKVASTELLAHYCTQIGFIKYEYLNLDGSQLIINIKKIK
jgi:hypothetical protein